MFPTQIIVTKELGEKNHIWLKSLSDRLKKEELRRLLEEVEGLTQKLEKELADSVLEVSIRANLELVDELKGDENVCQALLEIMEPEINKIAEKAAEKAAEKTRREMQEEAERKAKIQALDIAKKMIRSGKFTIEEILEYVPGISAEEAGILKEG